MKKNVLKWCIQWSKLTWICVLLALVSIEKIYGGGYFDNFDLSNKISAQQKRVTGKVTDSDGVPLPGVSVVVKGEKNKGVATDFDGIYSIEVSSGQVLVFSFIGFATQEVTVGSNSQINVTLKADTQQLDEVVVVGYGSMRKKDLTGSVVSLKPSKDDAAIANSFDDLLQGKAAGLNISTAGSTPGAAASVIIRGANSLTGDSQPLYVIDNIPQSSTGQTMAGSSGDNYQSAQDPLAGINPNDIEDIQILKDASATAIYGSRGANGVILITTKRGKAGKMNITVGSTVTIAQAYGLIDVMNLRQMATYLNKKHSSAPFFEIGDKEIKYIFESTDDNGNKTINKRLVKERNWQEEALQAGVSQEYKLNMNGGSQKIRYNFSATYKDVNGIVQNTGFKHGDTRLNLSSDINDKLSVRLNLSGFLRKNNMMAGGSTVGRPAGAIIPTALNAWPFVRPAQDDKINDREDKITVFSWITDYDNVNTEYKFTGSAELDYKIIPNLKYTLRTGGNLNNLRSQSWFGEALYRGYNNNGFYGESNLERNNYNVENLLFYNKSFDFVDIDATTGVTYDSYHWLNTSLEGTDFPLYVLRINGLHTANRVEIKNPIQKDYQLLSYLGRLNLSFLKGRYVLTGTFRADGTSKFSKGNQWGYFPSFALAWNVKEENFLSKVNWLNQFKLRAGYGITGSQNIDPYSSIFLYSSGNGYANPSGTILQGMQVEINNPNLKWETTMSLNAGADFGFFNGRLSGNIDFYTKKTKDLLVNITLPGSTSFNTLPINQGEIENKGFEIALNADIIRTKDFVWNIGGNISKNRTKILSLGVPKGDKGSLKNIGYMIGNTAGDHFGAPNIFIEGEAPGLFFGYKTEGIVQEGDTYVVDAPFTGMDAPGNLKVADFNGDGKVDLNDATIIGDPNPDFTYGFQSSIRYKTFRFKTSFTGVKGGDVFNADIRYRGLASEQNGDRNLRPEPALNAWTTENKSNIYPSTDSKLAGVVYDRYIEDGSFLRCSDITLGYALPKDVIHSIGLSNIDLFASVKNAFTITNYSGYDPTSRSYAFDPLRRGLDLWSFPMQRAYIFGINVTF